MIESAVTVAGGSATQRCRLAGAPQIFIVLLQVARARHSIIEGNVGRGVAKLVAGDSILLQRAMRQKKSSHFLVACSFVDPHLLDNANH